MHLARQILKSTNTKSRDLFYSTIGNVLVQISVKGGAGDQLIFITMSVRKKNRLILNFRKINIEIIYKPNKKL